jgi:hypothetical protein
MSFELLILISKQKLLNSYPAIKAMVGSSLRLLKFNQVSVDGIYENIIDMKKKFSIGKVNRMIALL